MSRFLSQRVRNLPYSGIREIFDLAGQMKDVIHFEIGEPDFNTPLAIIETAFQGAKAGMTHYTASAGMKELREKLAEKLTDEIGVPFDSDEIVITAGGMEALLLTMLVVLDGKDEVIFPSPHWPNYPAHVLLAGGTYRTLPLTARNGFRPDIEKLEGMVTRNTKMFLINYPHNPTGAIIDNEDLKAIAELAEKNDLLVCSDEAYESLIFDGRNFRSIAGLDSMKERTIIIRTFSKTYAMTGWRIGYLAAPKEVAKHAAKLHEHTSACTSSVSQIAALAALNLSDDVSLMMVKEYQSRRDILMDALKQIPGVSTFKPQGTFYAFVDVRSFGIPSFDLSRMLLKKAHVAVAPGSAFGVEGEGYIRICFANSDRNIREGAERMREFFTELTSQVTN